MTHPPSKPGLPTALMRYAALLALFAAAGTLHAQTSGSNNKPPIKDIYELKPINAAKKGPKDLPYKVGTSIAFKETVPGDPEPAPKEEDIQWNADKGDPAFTPSSGASVDLDFGKPFIKEETAEARKVKVTATYSGPASVENSPQYESEKVKLTYLDFLVAGTVESTDDLLIVRNGNYVLAAADKKVIHWAKVLVKHSATGKLPLQIESSGAQQLYFYGEQNDPNQLTAEPTLEATLSKEYNTAEWFWIGTDAKGPGEGKFKAKGDLGTGFKEAPEEKTVRLLPVEVNTVDRDVMSFQWAQKKPYLASKPEIYAGPNSGDMIEWRLPEGMFQDQTITWKAEHIGSGEFIPGPSGVGVNFWRIANDGGNDANGDEWLKWKPGTYRITCNLFGSEVEAQRIRVGYRSDQVLVIGQIVQTHTHDVDEPTGAALATWADAIADDLSGTLSTAAGILPGIVEEQLYATIRPNITLFPAKAAEAWTGVWSGGIPGIAAPVLPPLSRGPATTSYGLNLRGPVGTITAPHRYWMIQHLLNTNSDTPVLPNKLRTTPLNSEDRGSSPVVFSYKQYRFYQRFQARFLVDAQGKIENPASRVFPHIADVGPTKLKGGLITGELGSVGGLPIPWNDMLMDLSTEPAEASLHNGTINYSADGKSMSGYASARIGLKGQQASYRQFGKDAPWIFSEVILQLDPQGEVQLMGRTSTTVQWKFESSTLTPEVTVSRSPYAPASTPGIAIFNNLNIYTRSSINEFNVLKKGVLGMEGHLNSFVESASGAWPETPIAPSIR